MLICIKLFKLGRLDNKLCITVSRAEDNSVLHSAHDFPWSWTVALLSVTWPSTRGVGKSSVCMQVMRKVEYQGSTRVVVKCNNDREYAIPQVISAGQCIFPGLTSDLFSF